MQLGLGFLKKYHQMPSPPFFKDYFFMWTILKVFIEFVTILLLSYVGGFWP